MRWKVILPLVAVVLVAGAFVAVDLFAPDGATKVQQAMPAGTNATALRQGTFTGSDDFHYASGTVKLLAKHDGGHLLRFEGYDARNGPDVYLYLTKQAAASTTQLVEDQGHRLRIPGGEGDGRATLRGDFNVDLPADLDVDAYAGLTIWCEQFNHFFGHAVLEEA